MHQREVSKKKSIYSLGEECEGLLEPSIQPSQFLIEALLAVARGYNDINDLLRKYDW